MRLVRQAGFTLVELLVVILIVGVLVAVAAPSFLGQTERAHASAAEQYLSIAYKAAKADSVSESPQGSWATSPALDGVIRDAEPEIAVVDAPSAAPLTTPNTVYVVGDSSTSELHLAAVTPTGDVCELTAPANGAVRLSCAGQGPTADPSSSLSGSPPPMGVPTNLSLPQVSGSVRDGQTLVVQTGSWSGKPTSYLYRWLRSSDGVSWTPILDVTVASYPLGSADISYRLEVQVAGVNAAGAGAWATSSATVAVAGNAPVNISPPTIEGNPAVGSTLTATPGVWSGSAPLSYSYQWQSDSYALPVLSDRPAAYWRLDETSGTTMLDSSGHRLDGSYSDVTLGKEGAVSSGRAALFAGGSATVADDPLLRPSGAVMSLELWVKPASTSGVPQYLIWKGNNGGDLSSSPYAVSLQPDGRLNATIGDGGGDHDMVVSDLPLAEDVWTLADVVANGSELILYLDGNEDAVVPETVTSLAQTTHPLSLGEVPSQNYYYGGALDEVALYSDALSSSVVAQHREAASSEGRWTDISGATASGYAVTEGDAGSHIRVAIRVQNISGSASAESPASMVP